MPCMPCMPRCAPFGVNIAIFRIASLLEALLARDTPRNPRGSDRHHSACVALSCFPLALPLPSTPTSLFSFARFITHHIPLLRGRYLPRHPLIQLSKTSEFHFNTTTPVDFSYTFYCLSVRGLVSLYILRTSIISLDPYRSFLILKDLPP